MKNYTGTWSDRPGRPLPDGDVLRWIVANGPDGTTGELGFMDRMIPYWVADNSCYTYDGFLAYLGQRQQWVLKEMFDGIP